MNIFPFVNPFQFLSSFSQKIITNQLEYLPFSWYKSRKAIAETNLMSSELITWSFSLKNFVVLAEFTFTLFTSRFCRTGSGVWNRVEKHHFIEVTLTKFVGVNAVSCSDNGYQGYCNTDKEVHCKSYSFRLH